MDKDSKLIYEGWKDIVAAAGIGAAAACSPGDPDCPNDPIEKPDRPVTYKDLKLDNVIKQEGRYVFGSDEKGAYVAAVISSYARGSRTGDVEYKNFVASMDEYAHKMMEFSMERRGVQLRRGYDSYDIMGKHVLKAYIDNHDARKDF